MMFLFANSELRPGIDDAAVQISGLYKRNAVAYVVAGIHHAD